MSLRLLIVFACLGCAVLSFASEQLHVGTFNVLYQNKNWHEMRVVLRKHPLDVLLLQETSKGWKRDVGDALNGLYPHQRYHAPQQPYKASGFALLSKYPIETFEHHRAKQNKLGFISFSINRNGDVIHGRNVHLQAVPWPDDSGTWWARMASIVKSGHEKDAKQLIESVSTSAPMIMGGDFNSFDAWIAVQTILKAGYLDPFISLYQNPSAFPTWQRNKNGLHLRFRIDYVFHNAHFKAMAAKVVPVKGSDHDMVIVTLTRTTPDVIKSNKP